MEEIMDVPRPEYPRPQFVRDEWLNLNGEWQYAEDPDDRGRNESWYLDSFPEGRSIIVPFCPESVLSGIGDTGFHDIIWYQRKFNVPELWNDKEVVLNIGACDFECFLWVNGEPAGFHRGGFTPIYVDVTRFLQRDGQNVLTIRVFDDGRNKQQPRGKQCWELDSYEIWYTRCTGIWQSVWLEPVPLNHITDLNFTPSFDDQSLTVRVRTSRLCAGATATISVLGPTLYGEQTGNQWKVTESIDISSGYGALTLYLPKAMPWSPERPYLHPIVATVQEDTVNSYAGLRSFKRKDGKVTLNGSPYYLKMVLDQGYWPDGIYTAPTDDALRFDVEAAKALGFNGARKHQKVEDPRWLYWADTLGLITWGETGNAYGFTLESRANFCAEWPSVVARDINHPCIMAWVPFNESWGLEGVKDSIEIQQFVREVIALTHALDPERFVIGNDGWEQNNENDLFGVHDYEQDAAAFYQRWADAGSPNFSPREYNRIAPLAFGHRYNGQPVIMSEYGGIAFKSDGHSRGTDWGYGNSAFEAGELFARFKGLTCALVSIDGLAGYCYTQLTDVEQEINGLLTYDRKFKIDPSRIAALQTTIHWNAPIEEEALV